MSTHFFKIEERESLIKRLFFSLMPAAIIIMLSGSINSIVDGMIASNFIGDRAIAAIGYYTPLISVLIGISSILSSGALIICGNRLGKGDQKGADCVFSTDIISTSIIMLAVSMILFAFAGYAAKVLGAENAVVSDVADYIRGIAFSFLPMYLGNHLALYLEIEQKHIRNYIAIACMILVNICADLLFVKQFNLGCFGLGFATTVSSLIYFLILGQHYVSGFSQLKFRFSYFEFSVVPKIIVIGFPGAVLQLYLALRGYIYNNAIVYYSGQSGMAAFAAVSSFSCVFYALTNGIAVASRTLFSLFSGSEDRDSIRTVAKVALFRAFPLNLAISIIFVLCSKIFAGIYFRDVGSEAYKLSLMLFRICPLALALTTVGAVFSSLYQCLGRMKIVNIISLTDGLLGVCISMLILCPALGILGVWLSWLANDFFVVLVILIYTRVFNHYWPVKLEDFLVFKESFGVPDEMRINVSVHNDEDVVKCSKQIIEFFNDRGKNYKESYYAGLALEEMAGNIIDHGYKKDNAKHNAVIECTDFGDHIVVHVMDNCVAFNPLDKDILFDPDDPAKNIGIRLVQKIAKDIKYYRMVGINVLTITL